MQLSLQFGAGPGIQSQVQTSQKMVDTERLLIVGAKFQKILADTTKPRSHLLLSLPLAGLSLSELQSCIWPPDGIPIPILLFNEKEHLLQRITYVLEWFVYYDINPV